jgi:hypothetical protein
MQQADLPVIIAVAVCVPVCLCVSFSICVVPFKVLDLDSCATDVMDKAPPPPLALARAGILNAGIMTNSSIQYA